MRPLRVLMVTPRYPPDVGGVERHVQEVSRRLVEMGCRVTVLSTDQRGELIGVRDEDGVEVRRLRAFGAAAGLYFAPRLWQEMGRQNWDVVHVQSYHTAFAPTAMARAIQSRTPFVLTFHGGGHSSRIRHESRGLQRWLLGPLIRRAARLVAIARFEVDTYGVELGIPRQRFCFIPNGVAFATDIEPRSAEDLADYPVIASIGRLERYKGHHRVVRAFADLSHSEPSARLWIVGTGPQEANLRREVRRLGVEDRVEFRSVPSDNPAAMLQLLRSVNVVVSMSEFESHPIAALEAAAVGCALVVADTSGLREMARQGLARAIPMSASDRGVADAIRQEMNAPRAARKVELLTWDDCAAQLLTVYREVACAS
jgi:glycosyltransferase involved in cell wall biosynthesis